MVEPENSNYIKILLLVLKISRKTVRKKFDNEFHPKSLRKTLHSSKNMETLTRLQKGNHISKAQLNLIIQSEASSADFDLTLMIILLKNLADIQIGDKLPFHGDISEAADLTRIKYYRNFIAHNTDAAISDVDFKSYWSDIEQVVLRLSCNTLGAECAKLKLQEFQPTEVVNLLNISSRLGNLEENLSHVTQEIMYLRNQLESVAYTFLSDKLEDCSYSLDQASFGRCQTSSKKNIEDIGDRATSISTVVSEGINYLEERDLLLLTGKKGSGKTFNALEIIKHYCEKHSQKPWEHVEILQLSNEEKSEIINHFPNHELRSDGNKVVLLDNFLGLDNILHVCDDIRLLEIIIRKRGEVKIIVIVQEDIKQICHDVFTKGKLKHLFSDFPEIDLTRHWTKMRNDTQIGLIRDICGDIDDESVKQIAKNYSMSEKETGLPLLCRLFKSVPYLQEEGETFFLNPSSWMVRLVKLLREKGSAGANDDAIFFAALIQILISDTLLVCPLLLDIEIQNLENIITIVFGKSICLTKIDLKVIVDEQNSSLIYKISPNTAYYCLDNHLIRNALLQFYLSLGLKNILPTLSLNFIVKYLRPHKEPCQFEICGICIDEDHFPSVCTRIIDAICADKLRNTNGVDSIKTLCSSVLLKNEEFLNTLLVQYFNTETEERRILDTEDVDLTYKYSVKFFLPAVLLQMMVHHGQNLESVTMLKAFVSAQMDLDHNDTILKACGQTIAFILAKECLIGDMESISSLMELIRKHNIDWDCHIRSFLQNACASRDKRVIIWVLDNMNIKDSVEIMVRQVYATTPMRDDLKLLFEIGKEKQINFYRITEMVCTINHKHLAKYLLENFRTEIIRGYCSLNKEIPEENALKPLMRKLMKATISDTRLNNDLVEWLLEEFQPNREYFNRLDLELINK